MRAGNCSGKSGFPYILFDGFRGYGFWTAGGRAANSEHNSLGKRDVSVSNPVVKSP